MKSGTGLAPIALPAVSLALAGLALAGLALAGCSTGGKAASAGSAARQAGPPNGAAAGAPDAPAKAAIPGALRAGSGASGSGASSSGASSSGASSSGASSSGASGQGPDSRIKLAASSDIVYTARLAVRTANVRTADGKAKDIVTGMRGYVSGETTSINQAHPAQSTATLQLKVPVDSYAGALQALASSLGTQTSLQQQAEDVTGDVADVNSRVASDQSAIAQLRGLLDRASSVSDVLSIQNQINQQESDLESLQARQRALSHEIAYATVTLQLSGTALPPPQDKQPHRSGFIQGLSGGWHALRVMAAGLFTGFGAVLPFAVILAAVGYLAYRWRRVLARRRAGTAE